MPGTNRGGFSRWPVPQLCRLPIWSPSGTPKEAAALIEAEQARTRDADCWVVASAATGPRLPLRVLASLDQQPRPRVP